MATTVELQGSEAPVVLEAAYRALNTLSFAVQKTAPIAQHKVQFGEVLSSARDDTLEKKRLASAVKPRARVSVNRLQAEDYAFIDLKQDEDELDLKLEDGSEHEEDHRDDESLCGTHVAGSVAMSSKSFSADSRSFKSIQRSAANHAPQFNDAHTMAAVASSNPVVAALKAKTRLMHDLESVHTITSLATTSPGHSKDQIPLPLMTFHQTSPGSQAPSAADHMFDQLQSALTASTPKVRGGRRASISLSAAAFTSANNSGTFAMSSASSMGALSRSNSALIGTLDSPSSAANTSFARSSAAPVGLSVSGGGLDAAHLQLSPPAVGPVAELRAEGEMRGRRRASLCMQDDASRSSTGFPGGIEPSLLAPLRNALQQQVGAGEGSDGKAGEKGMSPAQVAARRRHSLALPDGVANRLGAAGGAAAQRRASLVMSPAPSTDADAAGPVPVQPGGLVPSTSIRVRRASTSLVSMAAAHVPAGAHHSVSGFPTAAPGGAACASACMAGSERVPAYGRRSSSTPTPPDEAGGSPDADGSVRRLQLSTSRARHSRLADSHAAAPGSPAGSPSAGDMEAVESQGGLISTIKSWMMGAEAAGVRKQ